MKQSTIKSLLSCSRSFSSSIKHKDFYGIANITTKDIAGGFSGTKLALEEVEQKYEPLLATRKKLENEVVELDVTFGQMRFDSENVPKRHGQYEASNERRKYDTISIKQAFVPEDPDVIARLKNENVANDISDEDELNKPFVPKHEGERPPVRIVDVQPTARINEILDSFDSTVSVKEELGKYDNKPPLTFFFKYTVHRENDSAVKEKNENDQNTSSQRERIEKLTGTTLTNEDLERNIRELSTIKDNKPPLIYDPTKIVKDIEDLVEQETPDTMETKLKFDKTIEEQVDVDTSRPLGEASASDYLRKLRNKRSEPIVKNLKQRLQTDPDVYPIKSTITLDSKGFKVYTNQVPNWFKCRRVDVLSFVEKSIIYNNYDILAINKPYGISSHSEDESDKEAFDMNSLVSEIAKTKLRYEKVYLAHRLDKTTTGVLLFATSEKRAKLLAKQFRSDEIKKTYWCITRGIPDPEEAIIDIPVGEFNVAGKMRSCLAPEDVESLRQLTKRYRESRRAITEYRVLYAQQHCALVEVKPRSGVKHQIRVHLGFGINRPILGDHKYSHLTKLVPQTLPVPMLNQLHLRQSKVRTLPIHLHAKSIVIPGAKANGESLFIHAPLPRHFADNLKTLQLMKPEEIKNMYLRQ